MPRLKCNKITKTQIDMWTVVHFTVEENVPFLCWIINKCDLQKGCIFLRHGVRNYKAALT